jgi:hypothetical protein
MHIILQELGLSYVNGCNGTFYLDTLFYAAAGSFFKNLTKPYPSDFLA